MIQVINQNHKLDRAYLFSNNKHHRNKIPRFVISANSVADKINLKNHIRIEPPRNLLTCTVFNICVEKKKTSLSKPALKTNQFQMVASQRIDLHLSNPCEKKTSIILAQR